MEDIRIKNNETIAQTQAYRASTSSNIAQEQAIKEEAEMKKIKSLNDHMDLFESIMMEPDKIPIYEKGVSAAIDQNGKIDWQKIMENEKEFKTIPVFLRKPLMDIAADRLTLGNAVKTQNQINANIIRTNIYSGDPVKIKNANLNLGRKANAPINYEIVEPLLQGFTAYQDSLSEKQQFMKFSVDINKELDKVWGGYLGETTPPDYTGFISTPPEQQHIETDEEWLARQKNIGQVITSAGKNIKKAWKQPVTPLY